MRLVRIGTFETNSSSCHSLTVFKTKDYLCLKDEGSLYIGPYEYTDDHGFYYNNIDSKNIIPADVCIDIVKSKVNKNGIDNKFYDHITTTLSGRYVICDAFYSMKYLQEHEYNKEMHLALFSNKPYEFPKFKGGEEVKKFIQTNYPDANKEREWFNNSVNVAEDDLADFNRETRSCLKSFVLEHVLGTDSSMTTLSDMTSGDGYPLGGPMIVGDETIIKTYISC